MIINYYINKNEPLYLGYQYDHKANIINFIGFDKKNEDSVIYYKIEIEKDKPIMIPLVDNSWEVTQPITLQHGSFKSQLVEILDNDIYIQNSNNFDTIIVKSIKNGEQYEIKDPTLDLFYTKLNELYNDVKDDYEYGNFNGDSAYEVAINNGFVGTEQEWLESLKYDHSDEFESLSNEIKQDKIDIDNKVIEFNYNYNEKKNGFDENAKLKTQDFDENANLKKQSFDLNVNSKTSQFNDNYDEKVNSFNENASQKQEEFNEIYKLNLMYVDDDGYLNIRKEVKK